ncbi:MAG: hypothetical protein WCF04_10100, partial [Candidatus Nanopelagicales bacterium]
MQDDATRRLPVGGPAEQSSGPGQEPGVQAAPAAAVGPQVVEGATVVDSRGLSNLNEIPNEAIPLVPPVEGADAVGSVPQISAQRRWARAQLGNWRLYLVRFVCAGLAIMATVLIVPGLGLTGWQRGDFI